MKEEWKDVEGYEGDDKRIKHMKITEIIEDDKKQLRLQ